MENSTLSLFGKKLLTSILLLFSIFYFAEPNYVYHEASTNIITGFSSGTTPYRSVLTPTSAQSLNVGFKVEFQSYWNQARIYYTTDGSTPNGAFGIGSGTTQVISAAYVEGLGGSPTAEVVRGTIPAQAAGKTIKYIVSAWHSGGGAEIFANGPGAPCSGCGTNTNNASLATVYSYTVAAASIVEVSASGGTAIGSYSTLKAAFDAVNAGTHTGTVGISIYGNTTETVAAVLNASGSGSASYSTINIKPVGNRTVTGALSTPLIDLNGADNVTIDGLNDGTNTLTLTNTSTSGTTVRFIADATNNTLRNCTVLGVGTSTTVGTIFFSTGTSTGNDGNSISNNTITSGATVATNAIYSSGTSTAIDNSGITISNNNIADYFNPTNSANGVYLASNSSSWTITGNKFYQAATRTATAAGSVNKAIQIVTASGGGYTINNNTIGFANALGTGTTTYAGGGFNFRYSAIDVTVAATPVSNIQGNTISGISVTNSNSGGSNVNPVFGGIVVEAGGVNIGTTTANTIGANTGTGAIAVTASSSGYIVNPIYVTSSTAVIIQNNVIGSINATGTTAAIGVTFTGISVAGSGSHIVTSNTVGNSTSANIAIGVVGTSTGISTVKGIESTSTGAVVIGSSGAGNTIQNINVNANATNVFAGIRNGGSGTILNINYNTIKGIVFGTSSSNASTFDGIASAASISSAININNNQIGVSGTNAVTYNGAASGLINGISHTVVSSGATLTVSNNDFTGFSNSSTASSEFRFINNAVQVSSATISNNTFTNLTANTTGSVYLIYNSNNTAGFTINNNSVVTAFNKSAAGGIFYGYYNFGSPGTGTATISNNNFSNITLTGATTFYGIRQYTATSQTENITGNTISNITGGSSAVYGISHGYGATGSYVSLNNINNISTSSTSNYGIQLGDDTANAGTLNVFKNKIYGLSSSNSTPQVIGIYVPLSGTNVNIYNNTIGNLTAPSASNGATDVIRGISLSSGSTSSTIGVYYNTIYLNATSSGTNFTTSGIFSLFSSTATTGALNLRNNIIINNSIPNGTGFAIALRRSASTSLNNYLTTSNNNIFYAGTPGTKNLIYYDGTNADQTLATFQTRVGTTRESLSQTENTTFVSTTGSNADFLRIAALSTSKAESGAVAITSPSITDDFWGITRPFPSPTNGGTAPDIGASEFDGVPTDSNPPVISYTTLTNTCTAGAVTLTASITDTGSGVPTSGAGLPVAYFKINSGSYTAVTGTYVSGSTYTFSIGAGSVAGNVVSYYIVAQDTKAGTPNIAAFPSAGAAGFTANPPAASTPPTTPSTYTVVSATGGTATATPATLCTSGTSVISAAGYGSGTGITYQWQSSTDNFGASIVDIGTASATYSNYTTPTITSAMYYRLKVTCTATSTFNTSTTVTVTVSTPTITGTTPASRCGTGTVGLAATGSAGTTLNWYAASTGGASLFSGTNFTTPSISATTDYWVDASIAGVTENGGKLSSTGADGSFIDTATGVVFNVTSQVLLNSTTIYPTGTGTITLALQNSSGTELMSTSAISVTGSGISTPVVVPINFNVPVGTGYRLVVKAYTGITGLVRDFSASFPYTTTNTSVTGSYFVGASSNYYFFYNLNFSKLCASTRTKVTATVTSAPAITLDSGTSASICTGSSKLVTLTSTASNYTNYVWSVTSGTGALPTGNQTIGWTFSPTSATTYKLNASNTNPAGCITSTTLIITVNPVPTDVAVTSTTVSSPLGAADAACALDYVKLDATGGLITSKSLINENFDNGSPVGWTAENYSEGGTPANADWKLQASPYATAQNLISPDSSIFAVTDSDKQGSAGTSTETYLNVPSIDTRGFTSLSLNFNQFFRFNSSGDEVAIFISVDNGDNWSILQSYTSTQGARNAFLNTTIDLSAYINKPSVLISFGYFSVFGYYWAIDDVKISGNGQFITWTPTTGLYTDAGLTTAYDGMYPLATVYAAPTTATNYTAKATVGTCDKTATSSSIVRAKNQYVGTDTDWNTSTNWFPNVVPDNTKCANIPAGKTVVIDINNAAAKTLNIDSTGKLTINAGKSLTVTDAVNITNNATNDNLILESDANLLQVNNVTNTGKMIAKRAVTNINNVLTLAMDYVYWSSPVSGQATKGAGGFSPGTPGNRFYQYKESNDTFMETPDTTFTLGKGYSVRAETGPRPDTPGFDFTDGYNKTYQFTGVPNNGDVSFDALKYTNSIHGYNMVGNPYPSNIDFDVLYSLNTTKIYNSAWFWTNENYTRTQVGSTYKGNNYAVYNGSGGTPPTYDHAIYSPTVPYSGALIPNGKIKVGQGFIVQTKPLVGDTSSVENQKLIFKNSNGITSMRTTADGTFFQKNAVTKDRFWLTLMGANNMVNTILVGYIPGATNSFETDYDGELFVIGSDSFYSVLGAKKLAIQGKANNFTADDVVPLGNVYSANGNYTITLGNREGIFDSNQNIYLRDKLLNKYVNISNLGSYTFAATKGTDASRFEIVYKDNSTLGIDGNGKSEFSVYRDGNYFVVKSSQKLGRVELYDAGGRLVRQMSTKETQVRIDASDLSNAVYIIKAENSGDVKTKKIIK